MAMTLPKATKCIKETFKAIESLFYRHNVKWIYKNPINTLPHEIEIYCQQFTGKLFLYPLKYPRK